MSWHHQSIEQVLKTTKSTAEGLSEEAARRRLERDGPNELEAVGGESAWRRMARQFHDVLIYILILAAGLTAYLGEWVDTAVIAAVVLINGIIGYVQEGKAAEAMAMIRKMLSPEAVAIRDGKRRRIGAKELVVGDMVWLEAGDQVPADVRLVEVQELSVDEALLTGESMPVQKRVDAVDEEVPLAERHSMAFSGTMVARGTARALVVATGSDTEVGRIGELVAGVEKLQTPLLRKVDRFALWLSAIIVAVAVALFIQGWTTGQMPMSELFMLVVSLAVAAIPEGLPAIMTITLAIGVRSMADKNAIIRQLPAVETLGSVTVICSDKTGTLTRNQMTARQVVVAEGNYAIDGDDEVLEAEIRGGDAESGDGEKDLLAALARAGILCNDAELDRGADGQWRVDGEPTEAALVVLAERLGLDSGQERRTFRRLGAVPFESARRYMATLHENPQQGRKIVVKGAPEQVLNRCDRQRTADGSKALDRSFWQNHEERLADQGFRLLAVAEKAFEGDEISPDDVDEGLVLLGLVGLMDPPRDEAIEAVARVQSAGIRVKMITGDHGRTAKSIGVMMNIGGDAPVVRGTDVDDVDEAGLEELVSRSDIFARTSPEHKLRIVEALQRRQEVVSMTGDGVNDAPALRRADVGVAMGKKGTEATKQAADMVLADDNFATIAAAVDEGRKIYDNLKKTILFLLPTNGAEAMMVIAALVMTLEHLPITAVQILWVNMVTAVTLALALAFEPAEAGIMDRPPRPVDEPLIGSYEVGRTIVIALLIGTLALTAFFDVQRQELPLEVARTAAINTLVAGQLFYLFSSRFLKAPAYHPAKLMSNPVALLAAAVLIVVQLVFTYTAPFQSWFGTAALGPEDWMWVVMAGGLVFVVAEMEKGLRRHLSGL